MTNFCEKCGQQIYEDSGDEYCGCEKVFYIDAENSPYNNKMITGICPSEAIINFLLQLGITEDEFLEKFDSPLITAIPCYHT